MLNPNELIPIIHNQEVQDFLIEHQNSDHQPLLFKYADDPLKRSLLVQLIQRKKLKNKLPEWCANSYVIFPLGISAQQSSSEATAKLKAAFLNGNSLLDITGGMGVDAYYFSQVFDKVIYVERDESLAQLTQHNFGVLGASNIQVIHGDGVEHLKSHETDVVYADPHRRSAEGKKVIQLADYEPDITQLKSLLINSGKSFLIKTSPMLDISAAVKELEFVKKIFVISYRNECREVNYLLGIKPASEASVQTINITEQLEEFTLKLSESIQSSGTRIAEKPLQYLYEPNASIMKAGGTDALSKAKDLYKLHPNSNLLTGSNQITFPGKIFEILEVVRPYHPSLKKRRFNVISRNYPDHAGIIEKKLKLKPAKNDYLIATRLSDDRYSFIVARLCKPIH